MTTEIDERSPDWRARVTSLVLSGFQLTGLERDDYREKYLDTLADYDLMSLGHAIDSLWNVRGIRSSYLKNSVAAGRSPEAIHTLNILFTPFRDRESPITVIMSLRGLSHYGILSEDGFDILDTDRVDEALALMRIAQELHNVDDHDFWVKRSKSGGIYISDARLLELIESKRYPVHLIAATIAGRGTGNLDILLPVLEHETPAVRVGVL